MCILLLVWAQTAHIKSTMGAIGPVSKNIKRTGVQHQKSKFFFLYYLGDLWEEGELFTPRTIICLMASLLSAWWHTLSSPFGMDIFFIINFHSNCRYNSGTELWSMVDAPMSTVDVQTLTSMSVDFGESTFLIRKVNAPMSTVNAPRLTLVALVQSEVDAPATTSMHRH